MKKNLTLGLMAFVLVFTVGCGFKSVNLDSPQLSPIQKEVLAANNAFYEKFKSYNARGFADFYAKDAFIDFHGGLTPKGLELRKWQVFTEMKNNNVWYEFKIQSIDVFKGGVVVKAYHMIKGRRRIKNKLRYITWNKIDGDWKIIFHTPYHPKKISKEFK